MGWQEIDRNPRFEDELLQDTLLTPKARESLYGKVCPECGLHHNGEC